MSMQADYAKEREGIETLEWADGFATFMINGDLCYIIDIYVKPEMRKSHTATMLADEIVTIAKGRNCKHLTGSVSPGTNGATASVKVLLAYGFQLSHLDHAKNLIIFHKDI